LAVASKSKKRAEMAERGRDALAWAYLAGGAIGGFVAGLIVIVLEVYYLQFATPWAENRRGADFSFSSFWNHCDLYSPLGPLFWDHIGIALAPALGIGGMIGSLLGVATGYCHEVHNKWGEVRSCTLLWGFVLATPPLLGLIGGATPLETILMAPFFIAIGLTYGSILGLTVAFLERWRTRYSGNG
jgi:hypothetical protein